MSANSTQVAGDLGKLRAYYDKYVVKIPGYDCWLWSGYLDKDGYGQLSNKIADQFSRKAHRISWIVHNGVIPDGRMVLHECDNPTCVRPDHLFLGTAKDNAVDMIAKGRGADFRGEKHPMFGRLGALNPMFGKTHSFEVKTRLSLIMVQRMKDKHGCK